MPRPLIINAIHQKYPALYVLRFITVVVILLLIRAMALISTLKMSIMKASGMVTSAVVGDGCTTLTGPYTKENGTMTKGAAVGS